MIIVAIVVIILGILNLFGVFTPIQYTNNEIVTPNEFEEELPPAETELAQNVGGISSVTGLAVLAVSIAMIGISLGILGNQPWEKILMMVLIIDMLLKSINIVIQMMMVNNPSLENYLLALAIMAVEAVIVVSTILFKGYYRELDESAEM